MPLLKYDIVSTRRTVYGKAGDEVKKVADHADVQIVEAKDGSRYAVRTDELTESAEEIKKSPVPPIVNIETKKTKKPAPKNIQKDLF